ncbi:hypothetical protein A2643_01975 [Candidatus Nomurabacteria bacterium RIFCSPHIGHO2_01_FULL_39_220]|uniref:DUF8128 domain-containing protein n=1 Tax=Candidatus Nomurabacteria bacterium RIFCSPLOWO2_02_FULL_40_67 TaxID=1801787 RepID=A0A1F6Y6Y6_9BACT|nr:MAG: hypothetical protein UU01_C0007G0026 [Parcubacteria group bacterium GW2011_GWA2_40_37]OGI62910.1 MAG: hypothetical protein A2W12_02520 [Candidatus Nomurabacteria bacterium RBG_16_40_11]OGI70483.1 MAG: hypothetical protein A2643_01975 [Candidatus Nomurabacteria bacterium RIFCSPHIGHO2_01_FULL_39_220]OGI71884.1 MAG: hypothetical protein A2W56_00195 [Candidatus Nomurabacteria bacterium RIFCSPHIGHO2_02_41_18]OGI78874.1 MAG: hypothetical protein A3C65_03060 [Candidatus Nomurabacteria bacteriu
MADKKGGSDDFFGAIEKAIIEYWAWILVIIIVFFLWRYGVLDDFIAGLLPLFAVIMLGRIAWIWWLHYIQQDFISGIDFVMLEIIPPRDVLRSPKAMELFITNALYHFSYKGGREEYWQGAVWFWFSLEIVSIEGQVHFYIRTPTRVRGLIETQMYAQYPQAQVKEVPDYTLAVDEITPHSAWNGWGCELKLEKPEAFPIKTYVNFGLDKDPKEEFKVDPISPVVEFFGSLQKGEQAWMQIVITPSKKTWHTHGTWFGKHDWVEESKNQIIALLAPFARESERKSRPGTYTYEYRTPAFLDNAIKAISAKTSKLGFDTGIRIYYVAKKEAFNMSNRRNIRLIWRQYALPDCNQLSRHNNTQGDAYSGIFTASKETVMKLANRMLKEYRERSFFHESLRQKIISKANIPWPLDSLFGPVYFNSKTFVLNVEELATMWHFPGQILKVPTLERIESKEASPPTNLPI